MDITDERGERHSHCHGVPAKVWWGYIQLAIKRLGNPDQRAQMGIAKLVSHSQRLCSDPDCKRLNRRETNAENMQARYGIVKNLAPIRPINSEDTRERYICEGHPRLAGMYLCEMCARVATAKRLIDAQRERDAFGHNTSGSDGGMISRS